MDKHRVLFVDDEANILDTYRASLRKLYKVDIALGPEEGLKKVENEGPYAVVVSDLKMPGMDGIEFLSRVQQLKPDTVRVMLTGHADLETSIQAVNRGQVFRFLTKPTPIDEMCGALEVAVRQYSLVTAEKELLRGTLRGSIGVLTDILSLVNPEAFSCSERIKRLAIYIGRELGLENILPLELSVMLSQLGCVVVPDGVLKKQYNGEDLTGEEKQVFDMHPSIAANLLSRIPRMGKVSEYILHQNDRLDEAPNSPIEVRILKACLDYDALIQQGLSKYDTMDLLRQRKGWYDDVVIDILEKGTAGEEGYIRRQLDLTDLEPGMILDESLWSLDEVHIMGKGMELTEMSLVRVNNFRRSHRLPESIRVLVPIQ